MTAETAATPAQIAKGALRRLAMAKLEPTPENYARAWAEESGQPPPPSAAADARSQGPLWATLIEKVARGLERGGRQWTAARRKESLHRVLDGSRGDAARLQQRLQALMTAWETDQPLPADDAATAPPAPVPVAADGAPWPPVVAELEGTVRAALPAATEPRAGELADRLAALAQAIAGEGATPGRAAEVEAVCQQARRFFAHRHRLVDELAALAREMSHGLVELAEDDSWARWRARWPSTAPMPTACCRCRRCASRRGASSSTASTWWTNSPRWRARWAAAWSS